MEIRVRGNQLEEIEGMSVEYPYVYHHADMRETFVPWHWHEEVEFGYLTNGKMKIITANNTYLLQKNEGYFINSNVLCTMENIEGEPPGILDSQLFHPIFLGGHFKSVFMTKYLDPVLQNKGLEVLEIRGGTEGQKKLLKKLRQVSYLQKTENIEFQTRNLFSEIWLLLLEEIQNQETVHLPRKTVDQGRIQSMMSFIHQNYQEKISLEEIAACADVSKRECVRCFQKCIRKTPYEYLLEYRVEMAQKLLRGTDMPIIDIALRTGFSNGAYFGKVFKKACGKTPGEYRKQNDRDCSREKGQV